MRCTSGSRLGQALHFSVSSQFTNIFTNYSSYCGGKLEMTLGGDVAIQMCHGKY